MFKRLSLDALIGRYYQQADVDTGNAGQQITNVFLVARSIDQGKHMFAMIEVCKTKINGNSAPLFFRMGIGIDSSQRSDQRSFAVVDMPNHAYDRIRH
jgi:hypothetical protein